MHLQVGSTVLLGYRHGLIALLGVRFGIGLSRLVGTVGVARVSAFLKRVERIHDARDFAIFFNSAVEKLTNRIAGFRRLKPMQFLFPTCVPRLETPYVRRMHHGGYGVVTVAFTLNIIIQAKIKKFNFFRSQPNFGRTAEIAPAQELLRQTQLGTK